MKKKFETVSDPVSLRVKLTAKAGPAHTTIETLADPLLAVKKRLPNLNLNYLHCLPFDF
jgi:hypothetical protein